MSKSVRILATKRFEKDLRKLPPSIQKRFAQTLLELSTTPFSFELLSGEFRGLRKIRVGDYRAIYTELRTMKIEQLFCFFSLHIERTFTSKTVAPAYSLIRGLKSCWVRRT